MKKSFSRLIALIVCIVTLSLTVFAVPEKNETGFTDDDFLCAKGTSIVNAKGETVHLRGVNLGGWLLQEGWMCPVTNSPDQLTTLETLTERFGAEKAAMLLNTYQDNWITEYDLDRICEMGFNLVRVPFWYRNFYSDDKGTKITDENGNWDFSRLDWIIRECNERRLYVVLDLHGAPGQQNRNDHSGRLDDMGFYDLTSKGKRWRDMTVALWTEIAKRYCDCPSVAMYDFFNEPDSMHFIGTWIMYNRLYRQIRKIDTKHMITMEATWRIYKLPYPKLMGWKNVCYQLHLYDTTNKAFDKAVGMARLLRYNVPVYVGEFFPKEDAEWSYTLGMFNDTDTAWSLWSYKGVGGGADRSEWFLYGKNESAENKVDPQNDSFEEILEKWGDRLKTENSFKNTGHHEKNLKPFLY